MARIYVGGAGGAPSNNFLRSLKEGSRNDYLIGGSSSATDLFLADVREKYLVPQAMSDQYNDEILGLFSRIKPDFAHFQHDFEIRAISRIRDKIADLGVKLFLPDSETIENCVDKEKSYRIWKSNGVRVPETMLLNTENDLKKAFSTIGSKLWIRATEGAAGAGSLPTENYDFAKLWIDQYKGWGHFTASKCLTPKTVTWLAIYFEGELVVAQTRRRRSWNFGSRAISGVTGITGVGETWSNELVDRVAQDSIFAMTKKPHGIFGVDMTYDEFDYPNVTEINIGRFFTTHYFFTKAGLNLPEIYCNIALENKFPSIDKKINPLPDGLLWIRGMDVEPVLITEKELQDFENKE
jgi:hypothetical protein